MIIIERPMRSPITQSHDVSDIDTRDVEIRLMARGHTEKKNLAIFGIEHCARRTLPYGKWTCTGGREVIFNREYQPIAQRVNGVVSYVDRNEWVENIEHTQYYYQDVNDPTDYLLKHLGVRTLANLNASKRSLLICFKVLKEFTPPEGDSVSYQWSIAQ
jgi:hypothetical protein